MERNIGMGKSGSRSGNKGKFNGREGSNSAGTGTGRSKGEYSGRASGGERNKDVFGGRTNGGERSKGKYMSQEGCDNRRKGEAVKREGSLKQGKEKYGDRKNRGNIEGKVVKKSRCKAFGTCGGCQMIDVPYAEQLAMKGKETAKLLKSYVKLEGIIGMDQPEHYRNKVSAAFTHDKQGLPLSGVYKEGTHYIVPIEECFLENQKADAIIGSIRKLLPSFKIKTYDEDMDYGLLRHVLVRVGHTTGQIMVVLVLASPVMPSKNNFVKALLKQHPDITTIVVNVNDRRTSMVLGDKEQVIYGRGYIEDVLCGITFKISPKSFYQVNSVQTEKLYDKAIEYAGLTGTETVLDAYCGIGTIGMIAASKAKKVIGVELNRDAVKDAVVNAKRNKIANIEFYQKDAGEFMVQLAEQGEQIDTVFMDPPRSGSDKVFLDSLVKLKPNKVVYVSCNPETLERDLEYLVKKGYRGVKGVCVDMFPFTGHVETIVGLQRRDM